MAKVPSAVIAAGGLVGGYGVARWTRQRPLGGAVLAVAGPRPRSSGGGRPVGRPRGR